MAASQHAESSALLRAAALGDLEGVQRLLTAAAAADAESGAAAAGAGTATSATSTARAPCRSSRVQELLAGTFAKSKRHRTALHVAARAGHERVVAQLLAAGAPVHVCEAFGRTPIWTAAANGHTSVVQQLLEAGAGVSAAAKPGWTVLHAAASEDSASAVAVLQLLLEAGMAVNTGAGSMAGTALHWAAGSGCLPAVKVLLAAGADVDALDSNSATPLHEAATSVRASVVAVLVDAGAEVNAVDSDSTTPLHKAAASGRARVVAVLVNAGAEVNAVNSNKTTPLHKAAACGSVTGNVVAVLVNAGAEVNAVDKEGYTALCFAVGWRRLTAIKLLLAAGACCRDARMQITALSMAATETVSDWDFGPTGLGRQAGLDVIVSYLTSTPVSAKALVVAAMAIARVSYIDCSPARWQAVRALLVAAVQHDAAAAQAALEQDFPWICPWHKVTGALVTGVLSDVLLEATVAAAALESDAHHTAVQHLLVNVAALHDQQRQQQRDG